MADTREGGGARAEGAAGRHEADRRETASQAEGDDFDEVRRRSCWSEVRRKQYWASWDSDQPAGIAGRAAGVG